jgi:hypothetical protein
VQREVAAGLESRIAAYDRGELDLDAESLSGIKRTLRALRAQMARRKSLQPVDRHARDRAIVAEIRAGETKVAVAAKYGVTRRTVERIVKRRGTKQRAG